MFALIIDRLISRMVNAGFGVIIVDIEPSFAIFTSRVYWSLHLRLCFSILAICQHVSQMLSRRDHHRWRVPNLVDRGLVFCEFAPFVVSSFLTTIPCKAFSITQIIEKAVHSTMAALVVVRPEIGMVVQLFLPWANQVSAHPSS
jgi:hypothetical protein